MCRARLKYGPFTRKKSDRGDPVGRRPLRRPRLTWEDCVVRDAESRSSGTNDGRNQKIAEDRRIRKYVYFEVWSRVTGAKGEQEEEEVKNEQNTTTSGNPVNLYKDL